MKFNCEIFSMIEVYSTAEWGAEYSSVEMSIIWAGAIHFKELDINMIFGTISNQEKLAKYYQIILQKRKDLLAEADLNLKGIPQLNLGPFTVDSSL